MRQIRNTFILGTLLLAVFGLTEVIFLTPARAQMKFLAHDDISDDQAQDMADDLKVAEKVIYGKADASPPLEIHLYQVIDHPRHYPGAVEIGFQIKNGNRTCGPIHTSQGDTNIVRGTWIHTFLHDVFDQTMKKKLPQWAELMEMEKAYHRDGISQTDQARIQAEMKQKFSNLHLLSKPYIELYADLGAMALYRNSSVMFDSYVCTGEFKSEEYFLDPIQEITPSMLSKEYTHEEITQESPNKFFAATQAYLWHVVSNECRASRTEFFGKVLDVLTTEIAKKYTAKDIVAPSVVKANADLIKKLKGPLCTTPPPPPPPPPSSPAKPPGQESVTIPPPPPGLAPSQPQNRAEDKVQTNKTDQPK